VAEFAKHVAPSEEEQASERVWVPVMAEQNVPTGTAHPDLTGVMLPKLRRSPKTP